VLAAPGVIVSAANKGDFFVSQAGIQEQLAQVFLGGNGLGEHHGLAAAAAVAAQIEYNADSVLEGTGFGVVWERSCASDKALDTSQLRGDRLAIGSDGSILARFFDIFIFLKVAEHLARVVHRLLTGAQTAQPRSHVLEVRRQRRDRGCCKKPSRAKDSAWLTGSG
jgi:hypothetical protein